MKAILHHLLAFGTLSHAESREALTNIAAGKYPPEQIAAFLTIFQMRAITLVELQGFRDALLDLCEPVDLEGVETIDMCGTGGDGKDTFNISTLSAFVVAGAGYKVAKHGNYGVSSICGSSNVLQELGVRFSRDPDRLRRQLDQSNICFLHAPLFHPAMKAVAPVRKALGMKTFFNMLGPMVNPSRPQHQLVGVFSMQLSRLYSYLYQQKAGGNYFIVFGLDGYDELSLTGPAKCIGRDQEMILQPEDTGSWQVRAAELSGGQSVQEAASIFKSVLEGAGGAARQEVVAANSGLAIHCLNPGKALPACVVEAREVLRRGKALEAFESFLQLSQ